MKNKRMVLLISESNFLLDVAFERRKDCLYLRDLAVAEELQLVIPEYAFAEVEAKLASFEAYWLNMFEKAKAVLEELPASRRQKEAHTQRLNIFDDCIALVSDSLKEARDGVNALYAVTLQVAFTPEIDMAAKLRRVRGRHPRDVKDLEIYESILYFARQNQKNDLKMIFLERDVAHFDVPEVKAELADVSVEIYFSAGEVVKRVRELLGK